MLQLRESSNKDFYYLLEIDENNNQKLLLEAETVSQIINDPRCTDKKLKAVPEKETRGTITE